MIVRVARLCVVKAERKHSAFESCFAYRRQFQLIFPDYASLRLVMRINFLRIFALDQNKVLKRRPVG